MILAVGESVDLDFAAASGLEIKKNGTIKVDHFSLETSRPRFYAGGDVVTGASNVSNAMAYGKQAARAIDKQLMEADRWVELFPHTTYDQVPPKDVSESHRHVPRTLSIGERAGSMTEVVFGLSADDALDEACRCLRCDVKAAPSR